MNPSLLDSVLILLTPVLPLALVLAWCVPALRSAVGRGLPWAPLPGLLLALFGSEGASVQLDYVMLGSVFGIEPLTRIFLGFTAMLWIAAGIHARGYLAHDFGRARFELLWLATLAGNLGLIVARDVASFYLFFALMTFAAYGLVIHQRDAASLRAGRVYLAMAVLGEGLILTGLLLAASANRMISPFVPLVAEIPAAVMISPHRDLAIACLWLGFGVKAGLPLLHMWLPLAHPVAPVPASAVLSGAMIKAGVLAWLSMLPLGLIQAPEWGTPVILTGLLAAFGAAFVGVQQQTAKAVLAYSSISQMGFVTVAVGVGLQEPRLWTLLAPVAALYALHHALAKGALFLGVAVAQHPGKRIGPWLWLALALPGLALAGWLPSGMLAKLGLKDVIKLAEAVPEWWSWLPLLLGAAAVGTTLLVARYLWLLREPVDEQPAPRRVWAGWLLCLAAVLIAPFILPMTDWGGKWPATGADAIDLLWPPLAGIALAWLAFRRSWRPLPIGAGDVLSAFSTAGRRMHAAWNRFAHWNGARMAGLAPLRDSAPVQRLIAGSGRSALLETVWRREAALGLLVIIVVLALAMLGSHLSGT